MEILVLQVLQLVDQVIDFLPQLQQALTDNNVESALHMFRRVNPLLLEMSMLINPQDYSNLDAALLGLIETCAAISQFFSGIDEFYRDQIRLSAVKYIVDALQDIRPIIASSTEDTLNQNLERFFSTGHGYSTKVRIIISYSLLVFIGLVAGLYIDTDFPYNLPLLLSE